LTTSKYAPGTHTKDTSTKFTSWKNTPGKRDLGLISWKNPGI